MGPTFVPDCIINIQQFLLCMATSQHCHFPNHNLHCSDIKAICWPFQSWTLFQKHTENCVWVSHTEKLWGNPLTQYNTMIQIRTHELSAFICAITHNLRCYSLICRCNLQLPRIWWMWEFAASNVDAHANKQTITATCIN